MDKKVILTLIAILVLVGGSAWFSRPVPPDNGAASLVSGNGSSALTAAENSFDFGSISMAAGKVKHAFAIRNTGSESVTIGKMYTSCMCTTAVLKAGGKEFGPYGMPGHGFIPKINQTLAKGEEAIVEVIFDPAAHGPAGIGRIQRTITIENSVGQPLELGFSAVVTP